MVLLVTFKSRNTTTTTPVNNINNYNSTGSGSSPFINLDTNPEMGDTGGSIDP
jgi:hypothetical protein